MQQLTAYICILLTVAAVAALPQLIGPGRRQRSRPAQEAGPATSSPETVPAAAARAELAEVD